MADAKARRAKREVITISDEEEATTQPAAKSPKKEAEEAHSSEVAELQEQLRKSEQIQLGACRMADELEVRVKFLENLIDQKNEDAKKVVELEKRVHDVTKQLEEKVRVQVELENRSTELAKKLQERDRVCEDLEKRLSELSAQLEEEKKRSFYDRKRACEDRKRACEEQMREHERIEELTAKLAEYEKMSQQQLHKSHLPKDHEDLQSRTDTETSSGTTAPLELLSTKARINLLQLCPQDSKESTSLDEALNKLHVCYDNCNDKRVFEIRMSFECEACETTFDNAPILMHFLSERHVTKVRASDSAVSQFAVEYWMLRTLHSGRPTKDPQQILSENWPHEAWNDPKRHLKLK